MKKILFVILSLLSLNSFSVNIDACSLTEIDITEYTEDINIYDNYNCGNFDLYIIGQTTQNLYIDIKNKNIYINATINNNEISVKLNDGGKHIIFGDYVYTKNLILNSAAQNIDVESNLFVENITKNTYSTITINVDGELTIGADINNDKYYKGNFNINGTSNSTFHICKNKTKDFPDNLIVTDGYVLYNELEYTTDPIDEGDVNYNIYGKTPTLIKAYSDFDHCMMNIPDIRNLFIIEEEKYETIKTNNKELPDIFYNTYNNKIYIKKLKFK